MGRRRVQLVFLAVGIGGLVSIVAPPAGGVARHDASAEIRRGGTLRFHRLIDLDSIDPALAYNPDSWTIEFATCAKLYNYPDKAGTAGTIAVPEVARGYPVLSRGGRVATIQLKRGFRFHTGQVITAANFVAAFNRNATPRMGSRAVPYLHDFRGADAVLAGRAKTISGVRAVGRYTLRLTLIHRLADLSARLTMPFFCPVRLDERIDPRGVDDPPGSGPYYVAEWIRNRQVVLRRNPYYRGSRPRNVDRVVWTVGGGLEACRARVDRDEIDYCSGLGLRPTLDRADLTRYGVNRPGGRLHVGQTLSTEYFLFNHDRPAFAGRGQIPLKQAINYLIDRPQLVRVGGLLAGRRTDQFLPLHLSRAASVYPTGGVTAAQLKKARELLAKARFKPRRLVLYALGRHIAAAQTFQFNLGRIGIDVQIRSLEPGLLSELSGTRHEPFDVVLNGWVADYADGAAFFAPLFSGRSIKPTGSINWAYFNRRWVNRRIAAASNLYGAARRRAWAKLDVEVMRRDPPGAPFAVGTRVDLVSPSLGCYVLHPVYGRIDIVAACKK